MTILGLGAICRLVRSDIATEPECLSLLLLDHGMREKFVIIDKYPSSVGGLGITRFFVA